MKSVSRSKYYDKTMMPSQCIGLFTSYQKTIKIPSTLITSMRMSPGLFIHYHVWCEVEIKTVHERWGTRQVTGLSPAHRQSITSPSETHTSLTHSHLRQTQSHWRWKPDYFEKTWKKPSRACLCCLKHLSIHLSTHPFIHLFIQTSQGWHM